MYVTAQQLYIGGQPIGVRQELGDTKDYSAIIIDSRQAKDIKNHDISLKYFWKEINGTETISTDAVDKRNVKCIYPNLKPNDWICNKTQKTISFNQVCDGKYDCSNDRSDTSDENKTFCKIEPSLGYLYAIVTYVILGILSFNAVRFFLKKQFTSTITVNGQFIPLTQQIFDICKSEAEVVDGSNEDLDEKIKIIYPECDKDQERKMIMKILRTLWTYKPLKSAIVNIKSIN